MIQILAIIAGGAVGALLRFLVSGGVYQWLGRDFPYGTLAVNLIGSFLIGMMTEALMVEPIGRLTAAYRPAILIGFFGSFTTFSTFALETVNLLEQGFLIRAVSNALISVASCLSAAWFGILLGRTLFLLSTPTAPFFGWLFPYGQAILNLIGAFLIGFLLELIADQFSFTMEWRAAALIILLGFFAAASGLYLILHLMESGYAFKQQWSFLLLLFLINTLVCTIGIWLGLTTGKRI